MDILILGGTRFIGKRIVLKLLERGHKVTVFTRGEQRPWFWRFVTSVTGDRRDHEHFHRRFSGRQFDVVIDMLAFNRADVEAVIHTFAGRIGHYLLCSSDAVYRDHDDERRFRPVREEDETVSGEGADYASGKRAAELALLSFSKGTWPFPFTIFRPTVVEGPDDPSGRTWFWVQRVADSWAVLVPETTPSSIFRHAFVEDVAGVFVRAALNPKAQGRVYNVAGEEILSLTDYVWALARALELNVDIVGAPLEWIRRQPELAGFKAPFTGERFILDITKVKEGLGYRPTPLATWLRTTASWFLRDYEGPAAGGYADRTAEIAAAKRWLALTQGRLDAL